MQTADRAAAALGRMASLTVSYDALQRTLAIQVPETQPVKLGVSEYDQLDQAALAEILAVPPRNAVVLVEHIGSEHARRLREHGVSYMDASGNAHLRAAGLFVLIEGQPRNAAHTRDRVTGRAFQPAGLKVLFAVFTDPRRVNATYRDLAQRVDVSAASVKFALDDLEQRGHLVKVGQGRGMTRRLTNVVAPAKRWAMSYGDVLRPKVFRGRFRFMEPRQPWQWRDVDLERSLGCWGGEPAAEAYGAPLRPERLTLYAEAPTADLARTLRLVPAPDGPVEVLDRFWAGDVVAIDGQPVVPRLLAYADLLASGETRNLEVAPSLFEQWVHGTDDQ